MRSSAHARLLFPLLAAGWIATSARAQTSPPSNHTPSTATPTPTPPIAPSAEAAPPSDLTDAGDTVVRVHRRRRAATSVRTAAAEARRLPGTQGDAIRVVESLPGVGRSTFGSGALLLWGAAPEASRVYVDGVPIPRLFHGGGLRSALNGFFVQDIDLVAGAYGADFGNATAGMVNVSTAPLTSSVHGVASVDVLDASVAGSAALSDHVFAGAGVRWGYLDRLLPLVVPHDALQYITVPRYADYQFRTEIHAGEYERLTLFAFGSFDTSSNVLASEDPARARSSVRTTDFHRVMLSYANRPSEGTLVRATIWAGIDRSLRSESVGPYPFDLDTHIALGGARASWMRTLSRAVRVHVGLEVEAMRSSLSARGSLVRPPREGDPFAFGQPPAGDLAADRWSVDQANIAPFIELPVVLGPLELTPGLRLASMFDNVSRELPPSGDTPTHGVARIHVAPEPRLLVGVRATSWLSFKAGAGLYHAPALASDLSSVFGNATLGPTRSSQAVLGATLQITDAISFEATGFYRAGSDVVARNDAASVLAGHVLLQTGATRAYGAQFQLRHRLAHGLTGWLAYTVSRSEVLDRPGGGWRLSDYDQTHLFTAVASYELGAGWSIGARIRLISGLPRTPVVGRIYDTLTGDYQPVFGGVNATRLPLITSVDVRIDRTFQLGSAKLIVFLDVLNVLNSPPAEEILYEPTYSQRAYLTGLPIVADLGLRGEL